MFFFLSGLGWIYFCVGNWMCLTISAYCLLTFFLLFKYAVKSWDMSASALLCVSFRLFTQAIVLINRFKKRILCEASCSWHRNSLSFISLMNSGKVSIVNHHIIEKLIINRERENECVVWKWIYYVDRHTDTFLHPSV